MAGWSPTGAVDPIRYGASSTPASISRGPDGKRIAAEVSEHLGFLSRTANTLGVTDPVHERFTDAMGHWSDLHDAAELWRKTADRVEGASAGVDGRLGGIDASWQGADADAFLAHMRQVALAGNEITDSMRALAEALDHTAEAVRTLVQDMSELIRDSADAVSEAMMVPLDGDHRARQHLAELDRPAREFSESIEDTLRAFAQFCEAFQSDGKLDEVELEHGTPASAAPADGAGGSPAGTTPSAAGGGEAAGPREGGGPAPGDKPQAEPSPSGAAVLGAAGGGAVGGAMVPMGMMGGLAGRRQAQQRQNASRFKSNPDELFGVQEAAAPPVLGDKAKEPVVGDEAKDK